MRLFPALPAATLPTVFALGLCWLAVQPAAAQDDERAVVPVSLPAGQTKTTLRGSFQGYHYTDYTLKAQAGQTLHVALQTSKGNPLFNILPPGTDNVALYTDGQSGTPVARQLPDDGTYTIRVYHMRAFARRNAVSRFQISIGLDGQALAALPASRDALVAGTRYHATARIPCQPAYSDVRECEVGVVRRQPAGSATVDIHWPQGQRRILFIAQQATSSDSPRPLTASRTARDDFEIRLGDEERFTVPAALITGG